MTKLGQGVEVRAHFPTYIDDWIFWEDGEAGAAQGEDKARTTRIYTWITDFFPPFFIDIYVYIIHFFETSKIKHEKGHKKTQKCSLKEFIYSGNWKLEKTLFEMYQNNTAIEWITLFKKNHFRTSRFFKKKILMEKNKTKKTLVHSWGFNIFDQKCCLQH